MPRIIAIDWGSKRIGLAVTDPNQIIATALSTVENHRIIEYLKGYMANENVETIVVGKPKDGSDSSVGIEQFLKQLKTNFPNIKIETENEDFTSKIAFDTILQSGIGKMKRREKGLVDKVAAVLILQSYLEKQK
jgi:putative Holliday junction resolvase